MNFIPFHVGDRPILRISQLRSFKAEENRYGSYWRKSFSLRVLVFLPAHDPCDIDYAEYRIWEEICEFMQDNADADRPLRDLSAGIIWHDIGKWTAAWVGQTVIISRTWPWKIVCHKFAGPRGYRACALHANKSRLAASLRRKNSIKQTNVSSDECAKRARRWAYL